MSTLARFVRAGPSKSAWSASRNIPAHNFHASAASYANGRNPILSGISGTPPVLDGSTSEVVAPQDFSTPYYEYPMADMLEPEPSLGSGPPSSPFSSDSNGRPPANLARKAFSIQNPIKDPLDPEYAVRASEVYRLHVTASGNNTLIALSHPDGHSLKRAWFSGGSCGFKGANRSGYEAGYQCASRIFKRVEDLITEREQATDFNQFSIEIFFKGFGKGRDAFLSALTMSEGEKVRPLVIKLTDRTPIKIGGTRAKKAKRR